MSDVDALQDLLDGAVARDDVPGAVALVARRGRVETGAAGFASLEEQRPMTQRSIFRIASVTKPMVAAVTMMLIEDGTLDLDSPIGRWLPELADPSVLRTPASPRDDVVAAERPITVEDLLTFRAGWGFPSDFSLSGVEPLFTELKQGPPQPQAIAPPDEWLATLAKVPMLYQPGQAWLYNICSDILGVLLARATQQSLPDLMQERLFAPLGMSDTAFATGPDDGRVASYYRRGDDGGFECIDGPDGQWSTLPRFPLGSGGLVSTLGDVYAFQQMLLNEGTHDERQLITAGSVRAMMTDHLTLEQREIGRLFLEGQGWGYGGSVDSDPIDPWNVTGRYGWVGGTGTSAHVVPVDGSVAILLTQVELGGPTPPELLRDFWAYAAG